MWYPGSIQLPSDPRHLSYSWALLKRTNLSWSQHKTTLYLDWKQEDHGDDVHGHPGRVHSEAATTQIAGPEPFHNLLKLVPSIRASLAGNPSTPMESLIIVSVYSSIELFCLPELIVLSLPKISFWSADKHPVGSFQKLMLSLSLV